MGARLGSFSSVTSPMAANGPAPTLAITASVTHAATACLSPDFCNPAMNSLRTLRVLNADGCGIGWLYAAPGSHERKSTTVGLKRTTDTEGIVAAPRLAGSLEGVGTRRVLER